jgi:hypothetical protein
LLLGRRIDPFGESEREHLAVRFVIEGVANITVAFDP